MQNRTIFRSLLIAALAIVISVAPALADDSFVLHNHTGRAMKALYVAQSSTDSWGPDILNGTVGNGEDVKVSWTHGETECNWDVRGEFEDGTYAEVTNVDFCTVNDVTFNP
ncbi:MAG TPA: hypothetical protein VK760_01200 [Candidatus Acidoferrales bacterium]|jgi:hypothetical protein|nr:hypothetical protein [Candidatus Acidoferrales bacterium]